MRKSLFIVLLLLVPGSLAIARDFWEFPNVTSLPDDAEVMVYDPSQPIDELDRQVRDVTWGTMRSTFGDYNGLVNKPTIPAAQVNSDWAASSGLPQILNKPIIPAACVDIFDGRDSTVPGPANALAIGTVTTGDSGSTAAVTITGAAPNQVVNFVIPRGDPGATAVVDYTSVTVALGTASVAPVTLRPLAPATDADCRIKLTNLATGSTTGCLAADGTYTIYSAAGVIQSKQTAAGFYLYAAGIQTSSLTAAGGLVVQ